jgi:hypothetical protein
MAISTEGFIEYEAPDESPWRIERGIDLLKDFDIEGTDSEKMAEIVRWHGALCTQERAWLVVRRLYCVAPIFGCDDPDELRVWPMAEIAAKLGVPVVDIERFLEAAKGFWKRWKTSNRRTESATILEEGPEVMDSAEIDKLLRKHGFALDIPQDERNYLATRCMELQMVLENDHTKSVARSAIQQEIHIFFILDAQIRSVKQEIQAMIAVSKKRAEDKGEDYLPPDTGKKNAEVLKLIEARSSAQASLENTMESLGLTEEQTSALKKKTQFVDSLGGLIRAIQEYKANGDNTLLDGYATGPEIEILTTPYDLRPPQYRPDLVLSIPAHMENLFNPDYIPPPLSQKAARRLVRGFKAGLAEARNEEGESILPLDEERDDEALSAAEMKQERGISPGLQANSNIQPAQSPPRVRPRGNDDNLAVI